MDHAASRHVAFVNADAGTWLREGQRLEACAEAESLQGAVRALDRAITLLSGEGPRFWKARAVIWMNRGNVLQRSGGSPAFSEAIRCYDLAIADFERAFGFPSGSASMHPSREIQMDVRRDIDPVMLNALGAAWMNRGVAFQQVRRPESLGAAVASHERAIEVLSLLPIEGDLAFRKNLGAAFLNLADALLDLPANAGIHRAANAARYSIQLTDVRAESEKEFAGLNLKARRALIVALGTALCQDDGKSGSQESSLPEVRDSIERGLSLARHWRMKCCESFLHLETRLFRLGCQFLRIHHVPDLSDFVRRNLDGSHGAIHDEFKAIAAEEIHTAMAALGHEPVQSDDFAASMLKVDVLRELRGTHRRLGQARQEPSLIVA